MKRDDGQPLGRDDAQAQYEQMDWPVVREKITTQTGEIAADVESRQQASLNDHLAQIEALSKGNDFQQIESTLVQNVNAQKQLLEDAQ